MGTGTGWAIAKEKYLGSYFGKMSATVWEGDLRGWLELGKNKENIFDY